MSSTDFTNINDPAGVKALLEQLKASDSWQTLSTSLPPPPTPAAPSSSAVEPPSAAPASSSTSTQISSLLSKLQNPVLNSDARTPPPRVDPPEPRRSALKLDVRNMTFQQALPHLGRLADDERVRGALLRIREAQRQLERTLADERDAMLQKQRQKVDNERKMARITGGGISHYTAQSLNRTFENELLAFDRERVLPAWDGLVAKQQAELEKLGVPAMFVSNVQTDRDRQQRVMQVLEGILAGDD